jgi:hypothetical protein
MAMNAAGSGYDLPCERHLAVAAGPVRPDHVGGPCGAEHVGLRVDDVSVSIPDIEPEQW